MFRKESLEFGLVAWNRDLELELEQAVFVSSRQHGRPKMELSEVDVVTVVVGYLKDNRQNHRQNLYPCWRPVSMGLQAVFHTTTVFHTAPCMDDSCLVDTLKAMELKQHNGVSSRLSSLLRHVTQRLSTL